MPELAQQHCKPCEGGVAPLAPKEAEALLKNVPGWQLKGTEINRTYQFKNYYEVMAFVNATAWVSHRENHHPDILVGYNNCQVTYTTHAIKGLSDNDFICAAKLDALFKL